VRAREKRSGIWSVYVLIDLLCILVSFYLPYLLRYVNYHYPGAFTIPEKWQRLGDWALGPYTIVFAIWAGLCFLLLEHYRLYRTDRGLGYLDEALLVARAVLLASLSAAGFIFFLQVKIYSRSVFILNTILLLVLLIGWRVVKRFMVRRRVRRGFNNYHALVVGTGHAAAELVSLIRSNRCLGLDLVGCLEDGEGRLPAEVEVLGKVEDLDKVVRQRFIDEVFLAIDPARADFGEMVSRARRLGAAVRVTPGSLGVEMSGIRISYLGETPLIEFQDKALHGADLLLKRSFDIITSALALLLLSPFLLGIALAIRLDSRGPVVYVSRRTGRKGRVFNFYKFRTMLPGADKMLEELRHLDETDGPVFKIRKDPRVTRVGVILRRYSLDELPQLWNILKGEMSLVGPRPPTPDEVERYHDWQLRRLEIRPGLTCLWQISGRSDISFEEWMKLDLYYIDNWTFWLDLKIILRTIGAVLRGRGAY